MSKRDYYEVLGVEKAADEKDIKKAYRRVAMKYHPDRNPDDPDADDKFKEATEAYDVLMNAEKRAAYDRFGHSGVDPNMGAGGFGAGGGSFSDIFGDVFGDIFGGGGGRGRGGPQRGSDLRYTLDISLEDAVKGTTVEIKVPTLATCEECDGSGARKGSSPVDCTTCGGIGQVRMQQGFFQVQQTCPTCRGRGKMISDPCGKCHGQGRVEKRKTLSVKVPPGVDTGDRITFVAAALGGELEVPTLDGRVKLKIPAETQTGKLFRLRGKGVKPVRGGAVGDLLCRAVVETPVNLNKKQKELLREFQESLGQGGDAQSPRQTSWFEGVKTFFDDMKP